MVKTVMLMGIILVIVLIIVYLIYISLKFLKKGLQKVCNLNRKIDNLYYFTSRNHQTLVDMNTQNINLTNYNFDDSWSANDPRICHALGEIDGVLLTECEEAFEKHYKEGFRVFELDFRLTRDGVPVVVHDWELFNHGMISNAYTPRNIFNMEHSMYYQEFSNAKVLGKYTTLTMERFVGLANKYSDARFIISAKSVDLQYDDDVRTIFRGLFSTTDKINPDIKKRYILNAFSFEFLHQAMNEFRFTSAVYRCYHFLHPLVLAEQLKKCGVSIVIMDYNNRNYCRVLHDNGVKIIGFIVTKNSKANIKNMKDRQVQNWLRSDVDMFMTQFGGDFNEKI